MANQYNEYGQRQGQPLGMTNLGRLSQAMQDQSMSPIDNQGVAGSSLSATQVLAKLMQAYTGQKLADRQNDQNNQLAQQMQGDRNTGMQSIANAHSSPDPRAALIEAMSHPDPTVRDVAASQLKGLLTQKDLAGMATGSSVLANPNNPAAYQAKQNLQSLTPGSATVDESGTMVDPSIGALPSAKPQVSTDSQGNIMQTSPTGTKVVNDAPRISNTTNVSLPQGQVGENEFEKTFGKEQAKMLSTHINDKQASVNALDSIGEAKKLLNGGIHSGALADLSKGIDKASIAVFGTDPSKAARTEQFQSAIGDIVLGRTKELTGVISNSDREYLEAVSAGKITLEPTAMKGILNRIETGMKKKVQSTNNAIKSIRERGNTLPTIDDGVQREPAIQEPANDLDSFLRNKGF